MQGRLAFGAGGATVDGSRGGRGTMGGGTLVGVVGNEGVGRGIEDTTDGGRLPVGITPKGWTPVGGDGSDRT